MVEAAKDHFKMFGAIAAMTVALWLLILAFVGVQAALSSSTITSADLRDFLRYSGGSVAFFAVVAFVSAPFALLSDRRARAELAAQPILKPIALCVAGDGLYVLERDRPRVSRVENATVIEVSFGVAHRTIVAPRAIAVTTDGTIFVAEPLCGEVFALRKDEPAAKSVALAMSSGLESESAVPVALAVDRDGNVLVAEARGDRLLRLRDGGEVDLVTAGLTSVRGIAPAPDGSTYVSDKFGHRVLRVTAAGDVDVVAGTGRRGFAGDGGPARRALLAGPHGIALSADGSLYVADTANHRVRVIGPDLQIATVAGSGRRGCSGDGGPAVQANLSDPTALAIRRGHLYVADTGNDRIRVISPEGIIRTLAGAPTDAER